MVKHLNVCVFYKITEENFLPKIVQIGTFGWGYMEKRWFLFKNNVEIRRVLLHHSFKILS